MSYRRLDSVLHAARGGAVVSWCLVLAVAAIATDHPLLLASIAVTVLIAAWRVGVLGDVRRMAAWVAPIGLLYALLNPVFSRNGLTVFMRLGEVGPFGQVDLTVEALLYGLIFGLRALVVALAFALMSAVLDPDELLSMFRRVSPRSALTAVLALRMVPVLAADARRVDDARRCRADAAKQGRLARLGVLRVVTQSALDRSLDVAATLEVRGYGGGARPARRLRPWSRHDVALAVSATLVAGVVGVALLAGLAGFTAYPLSHADLDAGTLALCVLVPLLALAPLLSTRGVAR